MMNMLEIQNITETLTKPTKKYVTLIDITIFKLVEKIYNDSGNHFLISTGEINKLE